MPSSLSPFVMFQGEGSAALAFYLSVFPGAEAQRIGPATPGDLLPLTRLTIAGQATLMNDSPATHAFTLTPSISLFVECAAEAELRALSARLQHGGSELMPVGNYGFSSLFAWVSDRFGVSWQLNLA